MYQLMTAGIWLVLVFIVPNYLYSPTAETSASLNKLTDCVGGFKKKYKQIPDDMGELKAFCLSTDRYLSFKDSSQSDFDYINLNKKDWIIRSFSYDRKENNIFSELDIVKTSFSDEYSAISYNDFSSLYYYPFVLLEGYYSANSKFSVKLFRNKINTLVVREYNDNKFLMTANHDHVDEMLWLPDNEHIVFSATRSTRYADGIYLWNLKNNTIENMLYLSQKMSHLIHKKKWHLSLIGYNPKNYSLWFYIKENKQKTLDVSEFFSSKSINFIILSGDKKGVYSSKLSSKKIVPPNYMNRFFDYKNCPNSNKIQESWCNLSLQGSAKESLVKWRKFIDQNPTSSLYPYAIWFFISLHLDLISQDPSEEVKNKLQSDALNYISLFEKIGSYPSWVKASLEHSKYLLINNKKPSYTTSNLYLDF